MKILVTGNMGYVGPEVVKYLRTSRPDATLHGLDNAYFAHCLTGTSVLPERYLDEQLYGDVRKTLPDLRGYDAVVQLAAISNDPMGNQFETVTLDINQNTTISIAKAATEAGVKNFVFASSCSVYGIAHGPPRKETDRLNPVTAYAKSKIGAERELSAIDTSMVITPSALRRPAACRIGFCSTSYSTISSPVRSVRLCALSRADQRAF